MPSDHMRKALIDAENLLKELPDVDNIPGETNVFAFGLAAYIYIRTFELGCRALMEKKDD